MKNINSFTQWKNGSVDVTFVCAITHQKHLAQSGRSLGTVRGVQWTFSIHSAYLLKSQSENKKFCWSVWIYFNYVSCLSKNQVPYFILDQGCDQLKLDSLLKEKQTNKQTKMHLESGFPICHKFETLIFLLTGGNYQEWKRVFLTCPCHEIYRDEAVGLKSCKNTWKIAIFVKMWNLGQYRENLIFCQ